MKTREELRQEADSMAKRNDPEEMRALTQEHILAVLLDIRDLLNKEANT